MKIRSRETTVHTTTAFAALSAYLKERRFGSVVIICDENTMSNCLAILLTAVPALASAEVIETESGETNKSLEVCAGIWQSLAEQGAGRDTLIVNLGGGVICDMGGFCAALYKRGIPFVHVPTTLLAMADAAIGGKTAIDLLHIKNLVGTIALPEAVFIEKTFLSTLPERHFYNGLAEVFKIALAHDGRLFSYMEKEEGGADIQRLIDAAVSIKSKIVSRDLFDKGLRRTLNFGHTIGHALEGLALQEELDVLHGEAVVAGMIMECHIAHQKKLMTKSVLHRVVSLLLGFYGKIPFGFEAEDLAKFLGHDKKKKARSVVFSLVTEPGKCLVDVPATQRQVAKAVEFYRQLADAEN